MPSPSLPPDFFPPALQEKIDLLAKHYHLSMVGVISLSVENLWDKKIKKDPPFSLKAGSLKSEDLGNIFLDRHAELELLRLELLRRL